MSVAVEPPTQRAPGEPEQGVIDDARRRHRRRRRHGAILVTALAGVGGVLAAALSGNSSPMPQTSAHSAGAVAIRSQRGAGPGRARLSPALTGGEYGWCLQIEGGGGTCPNLPTADSPLQGALVATEPGAHREVITFLLPREVASVIVNGRLYRPVTLPGMLPYRLRVARVTIPIPGGHSPAGASAPMPQSILAVNAQGTVLHPKFNPSREAAPERVIWWESPRPAPVTPCQIQARGMPALLPKWGHAAAQIHRYPGKIIGSAFFSCIDTEYYLHNWPLETAVLLDAQHPGRAPAPIPGMAPAPNEPGVFEAPGDWHGDLTAIRRGKAWLVVAGGRGAAQRLEVLRHLTVTVSRS